MARGLLSVSIVLIVSFELFLAFICWHDASNALREFHLISEPWDRYISGAKEGWIYLSVEHYVFSGYYAAGLFVLGSGIVLYRRNGWAILVSFVLPPLLIHLTPDVVYEVLYALFSPLLPGLIRG